MPPVLDQCRSAYSLLAGDSCLYALPWKKGWAQMVEVTFRTSSTLPCLPSSVRPQGPTFTVHLPVQTYARGE